jgi:hypothetical protein
VRQVGDAISEVALNVRAVGSMLTEVREQVGVRAGGVRAGIQAALGVLLKR